MSMNSLTNAKSTNNPIKGSKVESFDHLIKGKTYYIVADFNRGERFSGTAKYRRVNSQGAHYFDEMTPDSQNTMLLGHIDNYNCIGNYYLVGEEISRLFEIAPEPAPETTDPDPETPDTWGRGEPISSFEDLVLGRTYHIGKKTANTDSLSSEGFSGSAMFAGRMGPYVRQGFGDTGAYYNYCFCNLVPDKDNQMLNSEIEDCNECLGLKLPDGEGHKYRIAEYVQKTKAIAPTIQEPPISPEESERMIQEIQEVYEYLD